MIASSAARWSVSAAAARLVEQPGVLEGDAQARGERRQQPDVGLAEGVLAIEVLERDDARGLAADDERREEGRPGRLAGQRTRSPTPRSVRLPSTGVDVVDAQRLRRSSSTWRRNPRPERDRLVREADAALDRVREVDQVGLRGRRSRCRRPGRRRSRWILSPTRSYIACMSSSAARPCWTLLMIASSAARSFVSASRRFVSSNRRAFSSATPMLDARVVSSRSSASVKASARGSRAAMTPMTRVAGQDRDAEPRLGVATRRSDDRAERASASSRVPSRSGRPDSMTIDVRPSPSGNGVDVDRARRRRPSTGS